jgi:microcystin-dependent protein
LAKVPIIADVPDSLGQPIAGYVQITLDYLLSKGDTAYLPAPARVILPGTLPHPTFELESSEAEGITYLFEIFRTASGEPDQLLKSFRAQVPPGAVGLSLADLAETTGIRHDALDVSILSVIRRLYVDDQFWAALQAQVLTPKGAYNPAAPYKRGNIVEYLGDGYLYKAATSEVGKVPTDTSYWHLLVQKGTTGTGTTGSIAAYDALGWTDNVAPGRLPLKDIIETLARRTELTGLLTNPVLTAPTLGSVDPLLSDRTPAIPSTNWVQDLVDSIRLSLNPVGKLSAFAGTSAPSGWVLCDGRLLLRASYPALFAQIGTLYGSTLSTNFRVPDHRGRSLIGLDQMDGTQGSANVVTGSWADTSGGTGGSETHVLTVPEMPSHTHPMTSYPNGAGGGGNPLNSNNTGTQSNPTTSATGGGLAHNNMQPSIAHIVCIFAGV